MLIWITTAVLALIAGIGWLFLKRDPDRYIHEKTSPINFFFKWGHFYHHFFKIAILIVFVIAIFSLYKYLLGASNILAIAFGIIAGIVLAGGKELLDKSIQLDDVIASTVGVSLGAVAAFYFFW